MKAALAFVLLASIALYGCTQPTDPTATPTPTNGIETCGPQQCHGLDITCGPNGPQACTREFRIPDDACLQYVRCQVVNGVCQHANFQFQQCTQCVEKCKTLNEDDQTCMDRCASAPPDNTKPTAEAVNSCQLYRNIISREIACVGCAGTVCTTPEPGFEPFDPASDSTGIPYACSPTENGCRLAQ